MGKTVQLSVDLLAVLKLPEGCRRIKSFEFIPTRLEAEKDWEDEDGKDSDDAGMINYEATEPGSPAEAAQRGDDLDDLFAEGNQDDAKLQTLAENRTEDNEVVVQFMDQFMNNENFQ